MRVAAAILLLGLACCHANEADPKAVLACMSSQPQRDDYSLTTKCEPLGKSERITGYWFVGFETSLFREGGVAKGESPSDYHQLIVPAPINIAVHKVDPVGYAGYDVVFEGRRSRLQIGPVPRTFVADKIISIRPVPVHSPPLPSAR